MKPPHEDLLLAVAEVLGSIAPDLTDPNHRSQVRAAAAIVQRVARARPATERYLADDADDILTTVRTLCLERADDPVWADLLTAVSEAHREERGGESAHDRSQHLLLRAVHLVQSRRDTAGDAHIRGLFARSLDRQRQLSPAIMSLRVPAPGSDRAADPLT